MQRNFGETVENTLAAKIFLFNEQNIDKLKIVEHLMSLQQFSQGAELLRLVVSNRFMCSTAQKVTVHRSVANV